MILKIDCDVCLFLRFPRERNILPFYRPAGNFPIYYYALIKIVRIASHANVTDKNSYEMIKEKNNRVRVRTEDDGLRKPLKV